MLFSAVIVAPFEPGNSASSWSNAEATWAIAGLQALKFPCKVTLYSDSRYLVDAITKGWALKWKANGWRRNKKEKALNIDLWKRLLPLCEQHQVRFEWVKGHAGHNLNERCDELAMMALKKPNLPVDEGYEQTRMENEIFF